jgi:hypothetical protein
MTPPSRAISAPALAALSLALIGAVSIWQTVQFARGNQDLRRELLQRRAAATAEAARTTAEASAEADAARVELEDARARLRTAEARLDELAKSLDITPADQLKSYGRVEELAANGVTLLKAIEELPIAKHAAHLEGRKWDPAVFMKDMAGLIVNTEAIGQLEENPAKVAELHAQALREMLALDEGTSQRVMERLVAEFEALKAQGLTRPDRPGEGREEWYARRDQAVLEAAARIEALIPPQLQKPNAVAETMNLGTAFRNRLMRVAGVPAGGMQLYYQAPGGEAVPF